MFKRVSARALVVTVLSCAAVSMGVMWPTWRNELMAFGYGNVYKLVGKAATCYYFTYEYAEDGSFSYRDIDIQIGEAETNNPPRNTQQIVLASVGVYEAGCDSAGNCFNKGYSSGEITLPPEAVTFDVRLRSASIKATINVYSWEDYDYQNPIPVDTDLVWVATGERPYRQSQVYHRTTPWEIVRERIKETRRSAFITGTIGFQGATYSVEPESNSYGYLISDRLGQIYIIRVR